MMLLFGRSSMGKGKILGKVGKLSMTSLLSIAGLCNGISTAIAFAGKTTICNLIKCAGRHPFMCVRKPKQWKMQFNFCDSNFVTGLAGSSFNLRRAKLVLRVDFLVRSSLARYCDAFRLWIHSNLLHISMVRGQLPTTFPRCIRMAITSPHRSNAKNCARKQTQFFPLTGYTGLGCVAVQQKQFCALRRKKQEWNSLVNFRRA